MPIDYSKSVTDCSSNYLTFLEGKSIHCQKSSTYLTKPCGTIDIVPSPGVEMCDVKIHIKLIIRKYVVLAIDHLSFLKYDCGSTFLALYETPNMRSDELIRHIQCVRLPAGELVNADWNTMTVVWHRGREPEYGSTTKVFLATYYGEQLKLSARQGKHASTEQDC